MIKKLMILLLPLLLALPISANAQISYTNKDGDYVYSLIDGRLDVHVREKSGVALTAVYDDGHMTALDYSNIINENAVNSVDVTSDSSEVKTFVVNNLSELVPLKKAESLNRNSYKLEKYTTVSSAAECSEYKVSVNGEKIFTEEYKDISYARFAVGGKAQITIEIGQEIESYDISPHSLNIKASVSGKSLTIPAVGGQKLIVTVNDKRKLFIFADNPEEDAPNPKEDGVFVLTDYSGIDNSGKELITAAFQNAIDDVAAKPEGGILYVPNGVYRTGGLKLYSKVSLYLESGALIQGTSDKADYVTPIVTKDGNQVLVSALICFDTAENSKIYGRGIIDGDGLNLRATGRDAWLISMIECKNVSVSDVILRDPAAFNTHIQYSDDVTIDGVKLINDITNPNTDGIDPDSSRNVTIKNVFAYCSDDCVSVKTHRYSTLVRNSYNIHVKDNVFWTIKSALKIGDETSAHRMHDVVFENNDVIHADRAMTIYVYDGATVSNISFVNNRAEYIGGNSFKRHLDFWIKTRGESCMSPGKIENIIIKDFYAEGFSDNYSAIEGYDAEHMIKNVYIDNYVVAGVRRDSLADAHINLKNYTQNIVFTNAPELEPIDEAPAEYDRTSAFVQDGGYIAVEAEHYIKNTDGSKAVWREVGEQEKRGSVGGAAMHAEADSYIDFGTGIAGSPRLDYKVYFKEAGTYYLWTRTYGEKGTRNTIHAGIDGMIKANFNSLASLANYGGWYWNNKNKNNGYAQIQITSPGEHTINFWAGTTGLYFDRFILLKAESGDELIKYMSTGKKGMGYPESTF